jgi:glucans biosynthesis protein
VLEAPKKMRETSFAAADLTGFGLIQRERRFESYQDVTAAYHLRTSAWIEPIGEWGDGRVILREFPTDSEYEDNMVAAWVPAAKPRTLQPIRIAYRILWGESEPRAGELARVTGTFRGHPPRNDKDELFIVDFEGAEGDDPPEVDVNAATGVEVIDSHVAALPGSKGWQAHLGVRGKPGHPAEMELSLVLKRGGKPVSETWRYLWVPEGKSEKG